MNVQKSLSETKVGTKKGLGKISNKLEAHKKYVTDT